MWFYIVLIIVVLFAIIHYTRPENYYGYAFYGDNDKKPLFWGEWFNQYFYRDDQENNNKLVNLYR